MTVLVVVIITTTMTIAALDFEVQMDHYIEARMPDLIIIDKEKKTYKTLDFAVPGCHRVDIKERGNREKYLDFQDKYKCYVMRM